MPHTHALDRVHNALAPTALGRAAAGTALPLRAARTDGSAAAGAGAIFAKLTLASVIGLAFVIAMPFAGIAALAWFAASSCSPRPPEPSRGGCDQLPR
jgi:hypothetical protein